MRFSPRSRREQGVAPDAFRPSSDRFGEPFAPIVSCTRCGHGRVAEYPAADAMAHAYADAADPVSLREEAGQVETARRALVRIEEFTMPGRCLDIGCWTGSFLVAARDRGWSIAGVEPSAWAQRRAVERGVPILGDNIEDVPPDGEPFRLIALCDVLEHLVDPGSMLRSAAARIDPDGLLFLTLPDAGSALSRALGRRWWSVLPMHLQYFTRHSLRLLLSQHGFEVIAAASHPKVFTVRYYAERLGGYSARAERIAVRLAELLGLGERHVGPDLHDRMAIVARFIKKIVVET